MLKKCILCIMLCICIVMGTVCVFSATTSEKTLDDALSDAQAILGNSSVKYDCGDNTYIFVKSISSRDDYYNLCRAFKNTTYGYTETSIRYFGDNVASRNQYRSYTYGDILVELGYYADAENNSYQVRCVVTDVNYYKEYPQYFTNQSSEGSTEPLFTQIDINYDEPNLNGMSYLLRTNENTFIIIDGGCGSDGEVEYLYSLMQEQCGGTTPRIAAWILTHPHDDHISTVADFISTYGDKVVPEAVIFNFRPQDMFYTGDYCETAYNALYSAISSGGAWQNSIFIKPHTGETLYIDGAKINILHSVDDNYPLTTTEKQVNGDSLMFSIEIGGKKIMITADIYAKNSEKTITWYGSDFLKSDILQVVHHGRTHGSIPLYTAVAPSIAMWPASSKSYAEYPPSSYDYNKHLEENVEHNLYGFNGTVAVNLSDLSYTTDVFSDAILSYENLTTMEKGRSYHLENDIVIPANMASKYILPAGNYILDGRGYSITADESTIFSGYSVLVYQLEAGSHISNLTIGSTQQSINHNAAAATSANIGMIAGSVTGNTTLENIRVYASIDESNRADSNNNVGGLVGKVTGGTLTAINCEFVGTFKTTGTNAAKYFGGIVGNVTSASNAQLFACSANVTNKTTTQNVGDLIGAVTTSGNTTIVCPQTSKPVAVNADKVSLSSYIFTETGAAIRFSNPTGMRFDTTVTMDSIEALREKFGDENVKIGTLIATTESVATLEKFTKDELDENNITYLDIEYEQTDYFTKDAQSKTVTFTGAITTIKPENLNRKFSAVGYIAVNIGTTATPNWVWCCSEYNATNHSRSVSQVAKAALATGKYNSSALRVSILNSFIVD